MGATGVLSKPLRNREALDVAFAHIKKMLEPHKRSILMVEPDTAMQQRLVELAGGDDVEIVTFGSADEALNSAKGRSFDLVVTGIDLPDRKGFDLVDELRDLPGFDETPIFLHSVRDLVKKEETHLKRLAQTMVLKDVRSPERLMDEISLFLHRPFKAMPEDKQQMLRNLHDTGAVLTGKHVLIVDDDIRNIFAMTSLLEPHKMELMSAETGKSAIEILQNTPDIDIVLMDIMMPDMDGYDTMRAIRRLSKFRSLPIIALTAKAMKGDREKCIEAGASDYISKPVDPEQLLSLLRVWLYR
jgi:CheY-like chemotaxis protein